MRHGWRVAVAVGIVGMAQAAWAMDEAPEMIRLERWVIESAEYTGEVHDQIVKLDGRYVIRVICDGPVQIPLGLSNGTVTAIELTQKSGEAHLLPSGSSYALAASHKGTYKVHVRLSTLLSQDSQFEGVQLGIPQATFSTLTLIVPRKDVELRQADQLYVERQPDSGRDGVRLVAKLGAAQAIDLRWRIRPSAPVKIEPVIYGEVSTLVTLEEQLARTVSVLEYRIAQGETKELRVTIPQALNLLNVRGAGIEDWQVVDAQGQKVLTVSLGMPLKDTTYRLILEGEHTVAEGSAEYTLPEIILSGVKQERGSLGIARSGSIEVVPQTVEGANRIDVRELSTVLQAQGGSPAVVAFRYHQHPYRLVMAVTRHEDHSVLAAIAERGELVTVVSQQGELLTRASYLIQANKKQFLTVRLPEEANLWSCIVDGKSVKPVKGEGEALLIPLTTTEGATSVTVELVYFEQRDALLRIGQLRLEGPRLDVPTTIANWSVFSPREVKFLKVSGNLERGQSPIEFLDEPFEPTTSVASFGYETGKTFQRDTRVRAMLEPAQTREEQIENEQNKEEERGSLRQSAFGGFFKGRSEIRKIAASASVANAARPLVAAPATARDAADEKTLAYFDQLGESGILPLKIRLPKSGNVYHFSRLMTTQEALTLEATFIHLPMPWVPFAGVGLLLLPVGGVVARRVRRG